MTKEELLKRLHEILEIVGPDRAFEISENTNERKTLWIHQTPGEDEYLTLHLTLYPNFVSSKFVIACAALAELYPLSAKEFAKPVLQMAEKFHSFNTFDLKQIGFGRRRQVSDLPKCLQDLCLFFYSEISVYWSLAVTAESNAERQLIARAAIKKASTLAYLPCHADIDLKLLDLIHIAYTDGIQKSDLYRYDSQTFNIIISGETGELLCKYDES